MPERPVRAALCVVLGAALLAFAAGRSPAAVLLLAPCLLAVFVQLPVRPGLRLPLLRVSWLLLVATGLFALMWILNPSLSEKVAFTFTLVSGWLLALLAVLMLLGTRTWPASQGVLPATLGLFVNAALRLLKPRAWPWLSFELLAIVAGVAILAYLALAPHETSKGRVRRGLSTALFGLVAGGIAAAIILFLPWAQPRVEQAVARMVHSPSSYAGLSSTSRLGDIEELALSRAVVLRVWTPVPQKLRARVYTHFDGRAWRSRAEQLQDLSPEPVLSARHEQWLAALPGQSFLASGETGIDDADTVPSKLIQESPTYGILASPARPLLVRAPAPRLRLDDAGLLRPWGGSQVPLYGIINRPRPTPRARRTEASELEQCLALPEDLDPRLEALARELGQGTHSTNDRVRQTLGHLARECEYSLKVGRFRTDQPVAEFLFEKKRGYCEYFASAAAVLLRLQGVPTRYVTGFSVQDDAFQGGHYVVREGHGHAWIEIHTAATGWREIDPTPAGQYAALQASLRGGLFSDLWEALRGLWADLVATATAGGWQALVDRLLTRLKLLFWAMAQKPLVALTLPAGLLLWLLRRRIARLAPRKRARKVGAEEDVPPELSTLMARLDRLFEKRGLRRPPHAPPLEHLHELTAERLSAQERATAESAVSCYYAARFGGAPLDPAELADLGQSLSEAADTAPQKQ